MSFMVEDRVADDMVTLFSQLPALERAANKAVITLSEEMEKGLDLEMSTIAAHIDLVSALLNIEQIKTTLGNERRRAIADALAQYGRDRGFDIPDRFLKKEDNDG